MSSEEQEKPDLSGLVTVFAVIMAVQYSTESPDAWDVFIGAVSIAMGLVYLKDVKSVKNLFFSFLTAALIGLGLFSIYEVVTFVTDGYPVPKPPGEEKFIEELQAFALFFGITSILTVFVHPWGEKVVVRE